GFSRILSNVGRVLVHGRRLAVIGMVNMNMFLINVTDVDVQIGDRVTLIGKDGEQEIKVSYFGDLSDQLNYELLTRLDKSIPMVFEDEDCLLNAETSYLTCLAIQTSLNRKLSFP